MTKEIPEARFRLGHNFAMQPELSLDRGPGKGLIIGQNASNADVEAILFGETVRDTLQKPVA